MRSKLAKKILRELGNSTYIIYINGNIALGVHVKSYFTIQKVKEVYAKFSGTPISDFGFTI